MGFVVQRIRMWDLPLLWCCHQRCPSLLWGNSCSISSMPMMWTPSSCNAFIKNLPCPPLRSIPLHCILDRGRDHNYHKMPGTLKPTVMIVILMPGTLKRLSNSLCLLPFLLCLGKGSHRAIAATRVWWILRLTCSLWNNYFCCSLVTSIQELEYLDLHSCNCYTIMAGLIKIVKLNWVCCLCVCNQRSGLCQNL